MPDPRRASQAQSTARRLIICGSNMFACEMYRLSQMLGEMGIASFVPAALENLEPTEEKAYRSFKAGATLAHMDRIKECRTAGIVVANFDQRSERSYVGPGTFAMISVAFAERKPIYLLNGIPRSYHDELRAWGSVELHGNLVRLEEDFFGPQREKSAQIAMF